MFGEVGDAADDGFKNNSLFFFANNHIPLWFKLFSKSDAGNKIHPNTSLKIIPQK